MKILHYINNLGSGGAEKLLTDILPLMNERRNEIHLIFCNDKRNVEGFSRILDEAGIKITNFNTSFYNPFQVFKLIRIVRKEKFDIVHAHLFPTQYWLGLASYFFSKKTVLIKTEHSVFNERKDYAVLRPVEKVIYGRYRKIIGITEQVSDNLKNWLNIDQKIVTINNGVNLKQIREANLEVPNERPGFMDKEYFNILMVGRFDKDDQKDQTSLVMALKILPETFCLYLAGEGHKFEEVKQLANSLNLGKRVHFLGFRNDVYKLMKLVNLNVLSTNHEGLSGVTLENLASGIPFIGTDAVGVNNVVPDSTFLFPKKDPEALAAKILSVRNNVDLQKKMVEKALAHVNQYDIKIMVDKYLNLYETAIGEKQ